MNHNSDKKLHFIEDIRAYQTSSDHTGTQKRNYADLGI